MSTETTNPMPLLVIEAEGKIIASNFAEFDTAARQWLADINRNLRTDEEFDAASEDVKKCKQVEDLLTATRDAVLEKAETLNAELTRLSGLSSAMRDARLELSKQIETAKADQRKRLIEASLTQLTCDKSMRETFRGDMENAIKGKKNLVTIRESLRVALSVANDRIGRNAKMLDEFSMDHGPSLLPDRRNLEVTDPVALAAELRRRIEAAAAQAEAKRLREEAAAERQKAEEARREAAKARLIAEATTTAQAPAPVVDNERWLPEPDDAPPVPAEEPPTPEEAVGLSEKTELAEFMAVVKAAFMTVKDARARLVYPANQEIAAALADAGNEWFSANINKTR